MKATGLSPVSTGAVNICPPFWFRMLDDVALQDGDGGEMLFGFFNIQTINPLRGRTI